jgi:hypothetical protein
MDFYFVEVFINVLLALVTLFYVFLLNGDHAVVIVLALKVQEIVGVHFQEAQAVQRMDHFVKAITVFEGSFIRRTESQHIDAALTEAEKLFAPGNKHSGDMALPQLKGLMLV